MKPNSNPLEGAEDWCAVESTDPSIRLAYNDKRITNDDLRYRAMLRAQELYDQQIMAFIKNAGCFHGLAGTQ